MSETSLYQQLRGHLAALKLQAAAEALHGVLEAARANRASTTAVLAELLSLEVEAAEERRRASLSRFSCLAVEASSSSNSPPSRAPVVELAPSSLRASTQPCCNAAT